MPLPRKSLICLQDTPYYHCVSRCVRRAFLCGKDKYSGQSYEHRRDWVEKRLLFLTKIFAIDLCAYAVMSNHTHVVLHVDQDKARCWTNSEILKRWHQLFRGTLLTRQFLEPNCRANMSKAEKLTVMNTIAIYRKRLIDISWFMRLLNEYIAREANKEDHCTGRFWEGRFKSQALMDETALAACMAYVDLNPIRANIVKDLKSSRYTSVCRRFSAATKKRQPTDLLPFFESTQTYNKKCLPFRLDDYLELVEMTSRILPTASSKSVPPKSHRLTEKMGLALKQWKNATLKFEETFGSFVSQDAIIGSLRTSEPS